MAYYNPFIEALSGRGLLSTTARDSILEEWGVPKILSYWEDNDYSKPVYAYGNDAPFAAAQQEAARRDAEKYENLSGVFSPVNWGVGTDVLRDSQGRVLGSFAANPDDPNALTYAPWEELQKYPQLGGQIARQYQEADDSLGSFLTDPGTLGILAGAFLPQLMGGSAAGAAGGAVDMGIGLNEVWGLNGAGASTGATGGSGMWDWLDSFSDPSGLDWIPDSGGMPVGNYNYSNPWATPNSAVEGLNIGGSSEYLPGGGGAMDPFTPPTEWNPYVNATSIPPGTSWSGGGLGWRDALSLRNLFGQTPNINIGGGRSSGGGILDGILNDPLGAAFNATPFLLALTEANRQGRDIDGVLNEINGDSYRRSVLDPYDMETGLGRTALLEDQELRDVRGSSFGQGALNNYNYMRDIGRGDLASRASIASAGLRGNLINSRNANRNLLLGAGLNASGRLFSPQRDPFNLSALLGVV